MKIATIITKEEKDNTTNAIWVDPCKHIQCGSIDCDVCPLKRQAEKLREAQNDFLNVLGTLIVEGEYK